MLIRRLVILLILLLTGCGGPPESPNNTLRISFASDPTTTDPRKIGDFVSSTLVCLLYEGLTRCKSGVEVELALAEKVEISSDGKTYLFSLRKSYWSDGHPVTALDFEKTWKTILKPGFPALCAYLLFPIKNAEAYSKGLCSADQVGIRAINAHTLEVKLENSTPYFLSLTAFPLYLPTPSHITEMVSHSDKPICNGPFLLENMTPGSEITLKKNEKFWAPHQTHLENIHVCIIGNEMTSLQLFEKGELDIVGGPLAPITAEPLLLLKKEFPIRLLPMAASTFCTFNTETYPFSNKALRKAFALAVQNHPYITGEVETSGLIPANDLLPTSLCLQKNSDAFGQVKTLAAQDFLKTALEELQITRKDLEELTLYYKTNPVEKKIALTLQKLWSETLGITIKIEQMDPKSLVQRLYARNYQLSFGSWIAQFHDPINILERFKDEKNPKNYPGWKDTNYSEILNRASSESNQTKRLKLLQKAERVLTDETILIPLYHWSSPLLVHPRVHGLATTSSGGILLEKCCIKGSYNNTLVEKLTTFESTTPAKNLVHESFSQRH